MCEKSVVGKHGRGPIDYTLLFELIFVILTEAKTTDLRGGLTQNIVQQRSCRESLANALVVPVTSVGETRKRKYDQAFDVVRTIPTFGIVTTGGQWQFTKVDRSRENTMMATQLQNIEVILRRIVGVLRYQMEEVNSHAEVKDLMKSVDPKELANIERAFQRSAEAMGGDNEDDADVEA
eukprot:gene4643-5085_t